MSRCFPLTLAAVLLCAVAGCGGTADPGLGHGVVVDLELGSSTGREHYTLRCDPPGGSLPFAPRLCAEIHRHPVAMLDPGKARSTCLGTLRMGVSVSVRVAGTTQRRSVFGGQPFCDWPGGVALAIYYAAAEHDLRTVDRAARRLGCAEDPTCGL